MNDYYRYTYYVSLLLNGSFESVVYHSDIPIQISDVLNSLGCWNANILYVQEISDEDAKVLKRKFKELFRIIK